MEKGTVLTNLADMPEIDLTMVTKDGYLRQAPDGSWWVWVRGDALGFSPNPEIVPVPNTSFDTNQVVYTRRFVKKRLYLDVEQAKRDVFGVNNLFIIGATGYTSIGDDALKRWGIQRGSYEAASERLITDLLVALREQFPRAQLGTVDGAFPQGIDKAMINAAENLGIPHLGFTCNAYLIHGEDNAMPVYCDVSQANYSNQFIRSLDVLLGMNGRQIAFEHDMLAAIKYRKALVLINIVASISRNGGPNAYTPDGMVDDAMTAFTEVVRNLSRLPSETFAELTHRVFNEVVDLGRLTLPPLTAYGLAPPEVMEPQ